MQRCLIYEKTMAETKNGGSSLNNNNCKDHSRRKLLVGVDLFCLFLVLLVAAFLHKSPFPPYRRGFFCSDSSISLPYKSSTVSTKVLAAVGVSVPVVSVSPVSGPARRPGSKLDALNTSNGRLVTLQKTSH